MNYETLQALVQPDKVHRKVYTCPDLFAQEQEKIFSRSWQYLCHESEIPDPNQFVATNLYKQPVIIIRQPDNRIMVLANRCTHRGAKIVEEDTGALQLLRCPYHGWAFSTCGELQSIPCQENYQGTEVADAPGDFNLGVIRHEVYRGFIFATLTKDAQGLAEFLGNTTMALDNMLDRSPISTIEPVPGRFRAIYRNNWKIYLENMHDGMHPLWVHQSSIQASQQAKQDVPLAIRIIEANAQKPEDMLELEVSCHEFGHSMMRGFRNPDDPNDPAVQEYYNEHSKNHGEERSAEILNTNIHNVNIYPLTSAHPRFLQIRTITPLAVDKTSIEIKVFRWGGVSDEINQRNIIYANTVHSPASVIKQDDLEIYQRVQSGLESEESDWISQHSFHQSDKPASRSALSEEYIRNQYRAWLHYLSNS